MALFYEHGLRVMLPLLLGALGADGLDQVLVGHRLLSVAICTTPR
jgi:hypothetical protein